ncbi:MAG: RNA methyltransferase [Bacteroidales bacterium]
MKKLKNSELQRKSIAEFKTAEKIPLVVVLDNIRSQNNIGSIFRTSDAFLVEEVILCGITAVPPHPEIHKTALGSTDSVNWRYMNSTLEAVTFLRARGYRILAIEQAEGSIMLGDYQPEAGVGQAVIFGHEIHGVAQDVMDSCDHCLEIPQYGTKHSLNISVCAGMVIWEFFKKLS